MAFLADGAREEAQCVEVDPARMYTNEQLVREHHNVRDRTRVVVLMTGSGRVPSTGKLSSH
jgi:hypothetical protein